jgi:regulator of sigma E protease
VTIVEIAITIALFVFILGSLVLVHELGHFVIARLAGVRVLEFGVGFPPRAKVLASGGETLYTLNWLPIGGFVKLEGEDGDATDDPRSFASARLPVKLVILLAGVAMNLIAAMTIFTLIALLAWPLVGIVIGKVQADSPAARIGLEPGDSIVSIDHVRYEFLGPIIGRPDMLQDLRSHAGQKITLGVLRADGTAEDIVVTLRPPEELSDTKGALGIQSPGENEPWETRYYGEYVGHDPGTAVRIGVGETFRWFGLIIDGLGQVASRFATNPAAAPPVQGPVGIAVSIGQIFFGAGPILTLYVAGILSANLALVNALPFPPLDGGRMLVIVLKRLLGTRVSLQAERVTYFVGFAFLMAFLLWVTYFDVFGSAVR